MLIHNYGFVFVSVLTVFIKKKTLSTEHRSKFEPERKEPEPYTPLSSGPLGKPQPPPPQLPLLPLPHPRSPFPPSGSPSIPSAVTAHLPDSTTENWAAYFNHGEGKSGTLKHRCRDYDGKHCTLNRPRFPEPIGFITR